MFFLMFIMKKHNEVRVNDRPAGMTTDQFYPSICEGRIVWDDGQDIYLYENGSITNITANFVYASSDPAVYVNKNRVKIVWQAMVTADNSDIYLYDSAADPKISRITDNSSNQVLPAVWGDKIVWQDNRNGNWDIYLYDGNTEKRITTNQKDQFYPKISDHTIVWEDWRSGNGDIYMCNINKRDKHSNAFIEKPVCVATGSQLDPAIHDDTIVWEDNRRGNWDIYMYQLDEEDEGEVSVVCKAAGDQYFPAVYDDKVVWTDYRNGNEDIYMKEID
jgi:TolB protein